MADDVDGIVDREQAILDAQVHTAASKAALIPKGEPGDCSLCGEPSPRLIGHACARCRDRRGLP